jgi:hypothetical protein
MNQGPNETFWTRISAYLRLEKRRAQTAPIMLLLAFVSLGLLISGRYNLSNPWPYWISGAVCVGLMVAIVAFQEPDKS